MNRANLTAARRALVAAAAIASLAACGTSSPSGLAASSQPSVSASSSAPSQSPSATSSPSSATTSVARCRTAELHVTLTRSGAAAGVVGGYIGFRNTTAAPCRLSGWPTLIAVMTTGTRATAKHLLTTMFGPTITAPQPVTLNPGGLAEAVFTASENAGPCASGSLPTYRTLLVAPPGDVRSVAISAWLGAVNTYLPACGGLSVSPVVQSSALMKPN